MTNEINLDLVWGSDATGLTDPTDVKWALGWVSEIPTYQHFNYWANSVDSNLLALAEKAAFAWSTDITYDEKAVVTEGGITYWARVTNSGQQPSTDTAENYWMKAPNFGDQTTLPKAGLTLFNVNSRAQNTWGGNDITITNDNAVLGMYADYGDNWLLANVSGDLVVVNIEADLTPDLRSLIPTAGNKSYKLFHEGHEPVVAEVAGAVEEAPDDGKLYAREGLSATTGQWVHVTSTTVSDDPPPAATGAGRCWYNLSDGQLYVDVDDGDSTQYVPANPPFSPETLYYDNSDSALTSETVKEALDELAAMILAQHP